ncbi:MAG: hypothetical protein EHM48_10160, partial [Planctomycetaceae bacterium]
MSAKRNNTTWRAALTIASIATLAMGLVSGGLGCQKKPAQPAATTQAANNQATTSAATEGGDVLAPAAGTPATGESAATAPAEDVPLGANATQADYLNAQAADQRAKAHEQSAVFA